MAFFHSGVQYCCFFTVFKFQTLKSYCFWELKKCFGTLLFTIYLPLSLYVCNYACVLSKNVAFHNRHNLCTPPPCLTSGQSLPYLFAHSVCACICVYLSSDFCNPCFSSVSSSSGAVRIHSPHFFPSMLLSLSLLSLFLAPWGKLPWAIVHLFISLLLCALYMYFSAAHTNTHALVFCHQKWRLVSQSERELVLCDKTDWRSCSSHTRPYVSPACLFPLLRWTFASL